MDPLPFWLVMARLSGFVLVSPGLKEIPAPRICKAILLMWLTLALAPVVKGGSFSGSPFDVLVFDLAGEAFVGFSLGLVLRLIFSSIQMGGALLDSEFGFLAPQQLGLAVFEGDGIMGRWLVWVAFFYFWTLDYFSVVILALGQSFDLLPLTAFRLASGSLSQFIRLGGAIFAGGLTIAAPIIALMFVVNVGFGLMGRAIQGMPLFFESFTLRLLVSWGAILFFLPLILWMVRSKLEWMIPSLAQHLNLFSGKAAL